MDSEQTNYPNRKFQGWSGHVSLTSVLMHLGVREMTARHHPLCMISQNTIMYCARPNDVGKEASVLVKPSTWVTINEKHHVVHIPLNCSHDNDYTVPWGGTQRHGAKD